MKPPGRFAEGLLMMWAGLGIGMFAGYELGRHANTPPPSVTEQANANLAAQALAGWEVTLKVCEAGTEINRVLQVQRVRGR